MLLSCETEYHFFSFFFPEITQFQNFWDNLDNFIVMKTLKEQRMNANHYVAQKMVDPTCMFGIQPWFIRTDKASKVKRPYYNM